MRTLSDVVKQAYLPQARENLARFHEGPLINCPELAKEIREEFTDDEVIEMLKFMTPECDA